MGGRKKNTKKHKKGSTSRGANPQPQETPVVSPGDAAENTNWENATGAFLAAAQAALSAKKLPIKLPDIPTKRGKVLADLYDSSPLALHVFGHVSIYVGMRIPADKDGERRLVIGAAVLPLLRATELAPRCLDIAFSLAVAHRQLGQHAMAVIVCDRAFKVRNPTDPALHTIGDRRLFGSTSKVRIAVAREQLCRLLAEAEEKLQARDSGLDLLVDAADAIAEANLAASLRSVDLTRTHWKKMSKEDMVGFLLVSVEDMKAYYNNMPPSEQWLGRVVVNAVNFVRDTVAWVYWCCPACDRIFLNEEFFLAHIVSEYLEEIRPELWQLIPEKMTDKDIEVLESWNWKPIDVPSALNMVEGNHMEPGTEEPWPLSDDTKRVELLSKIKTMLIKRLRALSVGLVDKMVKFMRRHVPELPSGLLQQRHFESLRCIALLDSGHLETLLRSLQQLFRHDSGDWEYEKDEGDEQESEGPLDVVTLVQDASCLYLDCKKIVPRSADGSSKKDELFTWLFSGPSCGKLLVPWIRMRKKNHNQGYAILDKLKNKSESLLGQFKLKYQLSNVVPVQVPEQMHADNFLTEVDTIDVQILQTVAEFEYLMRKLGGASVLDYRAAILPAVKSYLWAKLKSDAAKEVLLDEDARGAQKNLKTAGNSDLFREKRRKSKVRDQGPAGDRKSDKQPQFYQEEAMEQPENCIEDKNNVHRISNDDSDLPMVEAEDKKRLKETEYSQNQEVKQNHLAEIFKNITLGSPDKVGQRDMKDSHPNRDYEANMKNNTSSSLGNSINSTKEGANVSDNKRRFCPSPNISVGEYRHFLNVVIRSLWHLRRFRQEFLESASFYFDATRPCVVRPLHDIFTAFNTEALLPTSLETALRNSFPDIHDIGKVETNCASKVLAIIFESLQKSYTSEHVHCTTTLLHYHFGMGTSEKISKYGEESKHINYNSFFHYFDMKSFHEFLAKHCGLSCDRQNLGCRTPIDIDHNLLSTPRFFTAVVNWENASESDMDINETLLKLTLPLDIGIIYRGANQGSKHSLVSLVCYHEGQYLCFACELDTWSVYDGQTVEVLGAWKDLLKWYQSSRLLPQVLFFEAME